MRLFVAFKGAGNSSNKIVSNLSGNKFFLTNSINGLIRDINSIYKNYDEIYMFGLDKKLKKNIRIEANAKMNDRILNTNLNIVLLNQKFNGNVVFLHVPSISYIDSEANRWMGN